MAGVGVVGVEAVDAGGLTEDLGGRERPAAVDREQRRGKCADERDQLLFEFVDLDGQLAAAVGELACKTGDGAGGIGELGGERVEVAQVGERTDGCDLLPARVDSSGRLFL